MQKGSKSSAMIVTIISAAAGAAAVTLIAGAFTVLSPRQAAANVKFTQETGKPCAFCHSAPPELNEQGKKFKANGFKL